MKQINGEEKTLNILLSIKWNEIRDMADSFSAKLKQATYLHIFGHFKLSLEVLKSCSNLCETLIISACNCWAEHPLPTQFEEELIKKVQEENITPEEFRNKYWASCVMFSPQETESIPETLQYELVHFLNEKCVVVDCKFFLHFLLYLNHTELKMKSHARTDFGKLETILEIDKTLSHKATALNLLGWVYKQEKETEKSDEMFQRSLSIRKTQTAAKLHNLGQGNKRIN